ncbi:hypothetical protein G6O69_06910 [Pseudenhygromyxa sp. WMMC2535]|uniref:hypothetical protein n=1 Tax=Pseudenhygromyxa sp. WMMC2535 TaxID=2712867 RepID=UPI0015574C88|nr:hypothetical protein [Pseudenhygromyxa sp. WMMC2535]NVB37556.1 hypothetical protein [Pseudenhygromyxa sp. WMMC2535]
MRSSVRSTLSAAAFMLLGTSACVQANPAFAELHAELSDESDTGTEDSDTDTGGGELVCALEFPDPLRVVVTEPCGETTESDTVYERHFLVEAVEGELLRGFDCEAGCAEEGCATDVALTTRFVGMDLGGAIAAGQCVTLRAKQPTPGSGCRYHNGAVWLSGELTPRVIARGSGEVEIPLTTDIDLSALAPSYDEVDDCDCAVYTESCCEGSAPPVRYEFTAPQDGELVELGGESYRFQAVHAYNLGGCAAEDELGWGLVSGI